MQVAQDGRYSIGLAGASDFALTTGVAAEVDGHWLRSTDYPKHAVQQSESQGELGAASEWTVTASGLAGAPTLVYHLRAYHDVPFADVQVTVENTTGHAIHVEAIRAIDASGEDVVNLGGPPTQDRVLSDSFSEDRPAMQIHDLADAPYKQPTPMHRGVGSQLVYNRESHESLFVGALTSDQFLTILRLHLASGSEPRIASYEVESTGTTELEKENSLRDSPAEDQIPLSLDVPPGGRLDSERVLLSVEQGLPPSAGDLRLADPADPSPALGAAADGLVELDRFLLRPERRRGAHQRAVGVGASAASRLQRLPHRRGLSVRAR